MADVAALTGDTSYLHAIDKIWDNVVTKKLYITGGIGATGHGEAFGKNYELPNMSAYCETCAAIANVYWNQRLFLLHGDSKYYDVLERTLYNGLISGVSLRGDKFFYPNPLESVGQHGRSEWFGCACCPSNICRFMPSIPGYAYAVKDKKLYVNLFVESEADINVDNNDVKITQTTNYPWSGDIKIKVDAEKKSKFDLMIRIPGWTQGEPVPSDLYSYINPKKENVEISVNGKKQKVKIGKDGYAKISKNWGKDDIVDINFPMNIHRTVSNENVTENHNKVSIERGPIVYCLEWVDNNENVLNSVLADTVELTAAELPEIFNQMVMISGDAKSVRRDENNNIIEENKHLTAIPYYAWANRGSGEMAVWIPRTSESARPLPPSTISTRAKVSASKNNRSLGSINDGHWPDNSNDRNVPFYSLWTEKNTPEWVLFKLEKPETISQASVYWYDDRPWGGCRTPKSWKVQYKQNNQWRDVKTTKDYQILKDEKNVVDFTPVTTDEVRLVFTLPENESSAIYEFEVK